MSIRNGLLSLLSTGPAYGFQLKKDFEESTGGFWPLNVGQVYTTLGRLVRDGLVITDRAHSTEPEGSAGEGDAGQRLYLLTERGREEVRAWFATPRGSGALERDELTIKVAMAIATGQDGIAELLQTQRTAATTALQQLTRRKARLEPDDVAGAVVLDAAIARIDAELKWLDLTEARLATKPKPRRGT